MRAIWLVALCIATGCANAALTQAAIAQPRSAHTGTPEKQPPASAYSKVEIDQKIDQFRKEILSTVPSKQELEDSLAKLYSKSEVDNALEKIQRSFPQHTVSQTELTTSLTTLDNDAKAREQSLSSRIPTISPWIAIGIAAAAALISGVSAVIAYFSKKQTRTLAAEATARGFIKDWRDAKMGEKHANARESLKEQATDNDKVNNIVDVFNWFDHLVQDVTADEATKKSIKAAGFDGHASCFLKALRESELLKSNQTLKNLQNRSATWKAFIDDLPGTTPLRRRWFTGSRADSSAPQASSG